VTGRKVTISLKCSTEIQRYSIRERKQNTRKMMSEKDKWKQKKQKHQII
jgi:hypothetical protein